LCFAKFFVIKSYGEADVHRSIKYSIWASTDAGNKKLDKGYTEASTNSAPVYLLYSVNASGHFCGVAEMASALDYNMKSSVWQEGKWKGQFQVKWLFIKDIPNMVFKHITLANNENKPVTNSRDTQEVPFEEGLKVLNIFKEFSSKTSLLDDFEYYDKKRAGRKGQERDFK